MKVWCASALLLAVPTTLAQGTVYPVHVDFAGIIPYTALSACGHDISCLEQSSLSVSRVDALLAGVAIFHSERAPIAYRWTWIDPQQEHYSSEMGNHPSRSGRVHSLFAPPEAGRWTLKFVPAGRDERELTLQVQ